MLAAALLLLSTTLDGPKPDKDGRIDPKHFAGVVVDDKEATKSGDWTPTTQRKPFVGDGAIHDGGKNRGKMKIRFTPDLPVAGRYRVRLVFAPAAELSSKTKIVLFTPVGATHTEINQRSPPGDGPAYLLGVFRCPAGKKTWLEITNAGADGVVVADAVVFEPIPPSSGK
jgi:hypothetical protein